ncbi:GAF domain-containing protein [uncultured Paludibaculum sp.]|uniref:GAF domain-containing protein n=1 Tax=uncultured Paludibaculum sp. TaxID=1765020 RepID=UPI002AABBE08|nr:GAF domain-containing protein [uncultured Paludibaculum sp.]
MDFSAAGSLNPTTVGTAIVSMLLASLVWWRRLGRLTRQRQAVERIYALSEEVFRPRSAAEILGQLQGRLLDSAGLTAATIFVSDPEAGGLEVAAGKAIDADAARRSHATKEPVLTATSLSLPMVSQGAGNGVLQCGSPRGRHPLEDEMAALRHLANQVGIALQLLEQRQLRDQLLRSEKLGAMGQLISSIAADLQPPLQRIAAAASGEELTEVSADAVQALETVERLIAFGRPEQARVRPVELNQLASDLAEFRAQPWRLQMVTTSVELEPCELTVLGSSSQLEQAILSVLVHAEQALQHTETKQIHLTTARHESRAVLAVEFSASSTGQTEESESQAWGLGVARGIVENHGGEFRLDPTSDGTRFEIDLPLTEATARPAQASPQQPARSLTMLLVHQDPAVLRPVVEALGTLHHRAIPVDNAAVALEYASRLRFDVVLASAHLPDLPWTEFAERMRQHTPHVGLIATASDSAAPGALTLHLPVDRTELERVFNTLDETA